MYALSHIRINLYPQNAFNKSNSFLLWTECLCPLEFIYRNPNSYCDGIRMWGLREVLRSLGWSSYKLDQCPYKK